MPLCPLASLTKQIKLQIWGAIDLSSIPEASQSSWLASFNYVFIIAHVLTLIKRNIILLSCRLCTWDLRNGELRCTSAMLPESLQSAAPAHQKRRRPLFFVPVESPVSLSAHRSGYLPFPSKPPVGSHFQIVQHLKRYKCCSKFLSSHPNKHQLQGATHSSLRSGTRFTLDSLLSPHHTGSRATLPPQHCSCCLSHFAWQTNTAREIYLELPSSQSVSYCPSLLLPNKERKNLQTFLKGVI